jgi:hypothetical protein
VPTLTLAPPILATYGLAASALRGPQLAPEVVQTLRGKLVAEGFDLTAPILVQELPFDQGVLLTQ